MLIHNGDHAEYEIENANTPPKERSDWPLPSFDARDWAEAYVKLHGGDLDLMTTWFANALMRGYDQRDEIHPREYKWQDIKTAPRDGTKVLYYSPGNRHAQNRNATDAQMHVDAFSDRWPRAMRQLPEAPYTHWRPLPSVPTP